MEYLKVADDQKASPKREFRIPRTRNQKAMRSMSNIFDAIAEASGGVVTLTHTHTNEDGFVRMKIQVKKQDLKQIMEKIRGGKNISRQSSVSPMTTLSLEQRLNLMRRMNLRRASQVKGSHRSSWTPALQSIPEEL